MIRCLLGIHDYDEWFRLYASTMDGRWCRRCSHEQTRATRFPRPEWWPGT